MVTSLLLVLLLAAAVAVATALVRQTPPSPDQSVAAARVHARRGVVAAVAVGAVAAVGTGVSRIGDTGPGGLGVTALLVPVAFGVGALLCLLVAELTWPRPDGAVRRADLVHRGPLDTVPRWLLRAAAVVLLATAVVLGGGALLADESGRALTVVGETSGGRASPFPGATYGVPAVLGLVVLWALALAGLRVVAERPAVTLDDPATETALRRASAHRLVRTAVGTTAVVVGGLLAVGGNAVRSVASSTGSDVLAAAGWLAGGLGLAGALAGVVLVLLPDPRLPEPATPSPDRPA